MIDDDGTREKVKLDKYLALRIREIVGQSAAFIQFCFIVDEVFPDIDDRYISLNTDEGEMMFQQLLQYCRGIPPALKLIRDTQPPDKLRLLGFHQDQDNETFNDSKGERDESDDEGEASLEQYASSRGIHIIRDEEF